MEECSGLGLDIDRSESRLQPVPGRLKAGLHTRHVLVLTK